MKKILLYGSLFIALMTGAIACSSDDDKNTISYADLPSTTKTFLDNNMAGYTEADILYVEYEKDGTYEVKYRNGIEIDFYSTGEWKKIDLDGREIPTTIKGLVPGEALLYIEQTYPNQKIDDIEKVGSYSSQQGLQNIKIELSPSDYDIIFDYKGNVVSDIHNPNLNTGGGNNTGTGGGTSTGTVAGLPVTTQTFLNTYLAGFSNPVVEIKSYKIEVQYNKDRDTEIEVDFYTNGDFMSIDIEENIPASVNVVKNVINGVSGSTKITNYIASQTEFNRHSIEDFSVVTSAVPNAKYVVKLDGEPVDYKLYFDASGNLVLKVVD